MTATDQYVWEPQPAAQALVDELLRKILEGCPGAARLARRMTDETATRFKDWIDFIQMPDDAGLRARLKEVGFSAEPVEGAEGQHVHHGGLFPRVVVGGTDKPRAGIKVESVADFLSAQRVTAEPIEGAPMARLRRARAFCGEGAELWAVERHGWTGFAPPIDEPSLGRRALEHAEAFRRRERGWQSDGSSDAELFGMLHGLVDAAVADLGKNHAADLFFAAEREYWQRFNTAARVQKARQDVLGLGWANHDHHTYRCSREHFALVIATFEKLGFHCRERFYAGEQAGWGAQVLEQSDCGFVIFADVDMSAEEVAGDFAHEGFEAVRAELGTVGLWVGLHGESLLRAGMHHLECQFDWHALVEQLETAGIKTMDPFTAFPFLRQAFTEGERWSVSEPRLGRLVERGWVSPDQAQVFKSEGAIGSHMENLERNDGYKGFNQEGVSDIISRTDPRKQRVGAGT